MRWLAGSDAPIDAGVAERLGALRSSLEKESNVVIVFGAELTGAAVRDLVKFGSSLPGQTRYMALGDYANSRGASDMGLLAGNAARLRCAERREARVKNSGNSGARRCPKSRASTREECWRPQRMENCERFM